MESDSLCSCKDRCGSCSWSSIPYEEQLKRKLELINGGFRAKEVELYCQEILPSPKINHYRNRMDFVIDFQGRVGLRERGKWWSVIDNHPCFLGDEPINELFHPVRAWAQSSGLSYYDRRSHVGFLRYAVIRASQTGERMVILVTSYPKAEEETKVKEFAHSLKAEHMVWSLTSDKSDPSIGEELISLKGSGFITENVLGIKFQISPNAFFQTNSYAAPLLAQTVKDFSWASTCREVLDLYCGSGFFALLLSDAAERVTGVELVPQAITDAKINAQINKSKATFIEAKAESYAWDQHNPDLVVVDPPRGGLHIETLNQIMSFQPKRVVYVSCNFVKFTEEFKTLQQAYTVENIRAIDLFPHTPHVELVTLLTRTQP